jgi:predicted ATPase
VVRSIQTGAGQVEYTPIGHTTNLASRMQTAAPVGSIAVSDATRKLCEGYFILKPLGATKVKGVSEPVNVYEVTGLGPLRTRLQHSAGRGLTKFVGRERELNAMKHALELAKAGHGQIVAAMAEPGVGKSRLFYEFKATSHGGCMVLETFSVSYGKASAYLPVIELLKEYFEIVDPDDERKRREKVNGKVLTLDRSLEDAVPYLLALLGIAGSEDSLGQMDGQIRRRRTLEGMKRLLLRESLNQPLLVIFEDLHWIDSESQALLNLLADGIASAHVLLLVNYRPEYRHEWGSKTYYTQLRLDPLGQDSADEMLSALLGDAVELGPLKRLVTERTEGNPFFMEEMVQTLLDQGVLVRNGAVTVRRSLSQIQIPTTVQGILAARIDRLPAKEKELLQTLAVLGKECPLGLIKRVAPPSPDEELERQLSELQLGEFIYEQPALLEVEYIFKHALTQEVAYNSVLSERRKQLHECAAQAIEALFGSQLENHLSELAHHYSRSANALKAVEYLQRASEQAIERSADTEAIAQLTAALDLLKALPDGPARARRETGLQLSLGGALGVAKNPGELEVEHAFSRAQELSAQINDDTLLFHALAGLWYRHQVGGEVETSLEAAKQLLSLAKSSDDAAGLRFAHSAMAQSLLYLGDIVPALEHIRQSESISTERRATSYHLGDAPARWLAISANAFWVAGYPDQALERSREALAVAEKLSHAYVSAVTRMFCGYFCADCRYIQAVLGHAEAGIALSAGYRFSTLLPQSIVQQGWALVHLGAVEEGFDQIRRGIAIEPPTAGALRHLLRRFLAEVYLLAKRADDGLRAVGEGLREVESDKRHMDHAELYRLKGELLLLQNAGARSEAESCFREAVEIARRQQAKSWELRATMSLARLLARQHRRYEARLMLSEIYGWFTEGFDTADLKDARALLDQLSHPPEKSEC